MKRIDALLFESNTTYCEYFIIKKSMDYKAKKRLSSPANRTLCLHSAGSRNRKQSDSRVNSKRKMGSEKR